MTDSYRFCGEATLGISCRDKNLLQNLTVMENILLPLSLGGKNRKTRDKERITYLTELLGIQNMLSEYPANLSGGEQRRVAIARTFAQNPKLVVADEPTSSLDMENSEIIMKYFQKMAKEGTTILVSTHDREFANYADRCLWMKKGKLEKENWSKEMQTEFIKLAVIFIVIMVMVLAKLKLRDAMIVAILLTVILFGIPLGDAAKLMIQSVYEKDTLLVVGSFILVTFLQRIMENRKLLERAEMALQRLSGDRRMVCVIAPVIIGFLPSAGAVNICGAIVDKATGKDLDVEEKTFVTSYYRHISESFFADL